MKFIKKWIFQTREINKLLLENYNLKNENKKRLGRVGILEQEGDNLRKVVGKIKAELNKSRATVDFLKNEANAREAHYERLAAMLVERDEEIE